ncbi:hypothetical protein ACLOJK_029302 [Asimina triloba]
MLVPTCHAGADVKGGGKRSSIEEAITGGRGGEWRCRRGRQREMDLGVPLLLSKIQRSDGAVKKIIVIVLLSIVAWIGAIGSDHKNWAIRMVPSRLEMEVDRRRQGRNRSAMEEMVVVPTCCCRQQCVAASPDLGRAACRRRDGWHGLADGGPPSMGLLATRVMPDVTVEEVETSPSMAGICRR